MAAVAKETSVLFSLNELKNLEAQRVADEAAKRAAAEAESVRVREAAAAAEIARIEAKRKAAADEALRIEQARAEAVRQERMAVEAAERAAMERHAAELAAQRQAEELAIKKMEAQKKRPRWMIGVTIAAVVAAGVLGVFTVKAIASSDDADAKAQIAKAERDAAIQEMLDSKAKIEGINTQLAQLDKEVAEAVDRLEKAQGAAEIKRAADELNAKRAREAKLRADAAAAEAERRRRERIGGVHNLCTDSAVCK